MYPRLFFTFLSYYYASVFLSLFLSSTAVVSLDLRRKRGGGGSLRERERERDRKTRATVKLELSALDLTIATVVCHYLKVKLTAEAMIQQVSVMYLAS